MDDFVDAYSLTTQRKQRIPRHWLDDPVLGRDFRKTPSQRILDGDLPARPNTDSTVEEIDEFADAADIDVKASWVKDKKLVAIETALDARDEQVGMVMVEPAPPVADPLAPPVVAVGDPHDLPGVNADGTDTSGGTAPSDESPATGNEEN